MPAENKLSKDASFWFKLASQEINYYTGEGTSPVRWFNAHTVRRAGLVPAWKTGSHKGCPYNTPIVIYPLINCVLR